MIHKAGEGVFNSQLNFFCRVEGTHMGLYSETKDNYKPLSFINYDINVEVNLPFSSGGLFSTAAQPAVMAKQKSLDVRA